MEVIKLSLPVPGDRDVGRGKRLALRRGHHLPVSRHVETVGQFHPFPWVPDVQEHESVWQLPVYGGAVAWAVSGAGPLQDPRGTGFSLVLRATQSNLRERFREGRINPRVLLDYGFIFRVHGRQQQVMH